MNATVHSARSPSKRHRTARCPASAKYPDNPGPSGPAAIDGTHDGMVRTLPTGTSGTYRGIAIAEEKGVDTQLVLARPQIIGNITIV